MNDKKTIKKTIVGLWSLVCSIACVYLAGLVAVAANGIAVSISRDWKDYDAVSVGRGAAINTYLGIYMLGLLFLILAFIIGDKYTRWLCAAFALVMIIVIFFVLVTNIPEMD